MSETGAKGPGRFSAVLPQPETRAGYYRDIAVLAFPTIGEGAKRIADIKSRKALRPGWLDGALRAAGVIKEGETL